MRYKQWERERKGVLNGWRLQCIARQTTLHEPLGKWTFVATVRGQVHIAHILVHSFDYYERRLHLRQDQQPITLLVCLAHTTCVPLHVEVLASPASYEPYQLPAAYTPERRGTTLAKHVLLGQVLARVIDPEKALADFAPSTRFAYLASIERLMKPLQGRTPGL